ncbi:MAG TPA: terminase family protein [bacterium]|nr:terminase family protein [bacterium]
MEKIPIEIEKRRKERALSKGRVQLEKLIEIIGEIKSELEENPFLAFKPNKGFQEEFLNCSKRFRVIFAGNRSGKSVLSAYEVCRFALGIHPVKNVKVPNIGWVVCPDSRVTANVMLPYLRKFLGSNIKKFFKREQIIVLNNGSEIYCKSCDSPVEKFTGASIRYCAIDEDCPEEIFREIFMRTIDQKGDLWITITPLYSTWMYEKIYLRQFVDPELEVFEGSTFENLTHLPEGELERLKTIYSEEELQARLYGKFLFLAGLIYQEFDKRKHLIHPFHIPDNWIKFRFIDHGINDPTVCLWLAVDPNNNYYFYREYYERGLIIHENVKNIIALTGKEKIYKTYIDPTVDKTNPQTNISDFRAYIEAGINNLCKAPLTEIGTKINKVKTFFKAGRIFIFNNLLNTIRELSTWSYKKNGLPERGNDHTLDCIGWACLLDFKYSVLKVGLPRFLPRGNKEF